MKTINYLIRMAASRTLLNMLFFLIAFGLSEVRASESFQSLFKSCDVTGSVTLYDAHLGKWITSDSDDSKRATLPHSTFKIFNSLVALDRGVTNTEEVFAWDGVPREFEIWNKDFKLGDAFRNSAIWVFEELAERLGKETYSRYLDWIEYGNKKIEKSKNHNFWIYGDFRISPQQQINFLRELYDEKLPFSLNTMKIVVGFMQQAKDGSRSRIFGKTGYGTDGQTHLGWWIGWKLLKGKPIFFATRIEKEKTKALESFLSCRITITDACLETYVATGKF